MRALAAVCLLTALLVTGLRLGTGVVYEEDEPMTYLVWRSPGSPIERKATAQVPVDRRLVLDAEEPDLSYRAAYLHLMDWAPVVAGGFLLGAGGAWTRRKATRISARSVR